MRLTKEKVAENKARVIATAARLFREKGFEGVGVADLMHAAGLTHGGFYNHFESKDALTAETCAWIFENTVAMMEGMAGIEDDAERAAAIADYKRRYLSEKARDTPAARCPMVALGTDVSRQPGPVRQRLCRRAAALSRRFRPRARRARRGAAQGEAAGGDRDARDARRRTVARPQRRRGRSGTLRRDPRRGGGATAGVAGLRLGAAHCSPCPVTSPTSSPGLSRRPR